MSQTVLTRGRIEYVNSSNGGGFIASEDTIQDVLFFQDVAIGFTPEVGQAVEFEVMQTSDGPRAKSLRRVNAPP